MKIDRLQRLSLFMIVCALAMIFAHIIIPHYCDLCCNSHDNITTENHCSNESLFVVDTNSHSGLNHHHCNITNIAYRSDSNRALAANLTLFCEELFDFTNIYSKIFCVKIKKQFILDINYIITNYARLELPRRAPPVLA